MKHLKNKWVLLLYIGLFKNGETLFYTVIPTATGQ